MRKMTAPEKRARVQLLIGRAREAYQNDRGLDRAQIVDDALKEAFYHMVDLRARDDDR